MDNNLYHHGVKGQQWGKRRYQNPDGSLTPAGKKRYASNMPRHIKDMDDQTLKNKINRLENEKRFIEIQKARRSSPTAKTMNALNKLANAGSEGTKIANNVNTLNDKKSNGVKIANAGFKTLSKATEIGSKLSSSAHEKRIVQASERRLRDMTDDDLRRTVERMNLEQRYSGLESEAISRGRTSVEEIMGVVGGIISLGATVTTLAVAINSARKQASGSK